MKRIPEPEIMDDIDQAKAYSNANFSTSNNLFVDFIINKIDLNNYNNLNILDLGCGPCDIDILLAQLMPYSKIYAIDGSKAMLCEAQKNIEKHNLINQIVLINSIIPEIDININKFDIIISKDLLHHLENPDVLWKTIDRFSDKNSLIFIMDLIRPENEVEAKEIVEKVSGNEPDILKVDFYNSLLASYTIDEIKNMLYNKNFNFEIAKAGDRHYIIFMKKIS